MNERSDPYTARRYTAQEATDRALACVRQCVSGLSFYVAEQAVMLTVAMLVEDWGDWNALLPERTPEEILLRIVRHLARQGGIPRPVILEPFPWCAGGSDLPWAGYR